MSPPVPQINTFLQKTTKPILEPISKVFIIASIILGVNRLSLIGITNAVSIVLMLTYTAFICVLFYYLTIVDLPEVDIWFSIVLIDCLQYLICTVLGFGLRKRLLNYYVSLNKFDKEIGVKVVKFGVRETIYNFLQLIFTLSQSVLLYFLGKKYSFIFINILRAAPIKLMSCFELHYYGHLCSLMIPRLKALSGCMELVYPTNDNRNKNTRPPSRELQNDDKKAHVDMNKLIDFYNNIIIAYDYLNGAVKWQMLVLLISIFSITLWLLYKTVKSIIWGDNVAHGLIVAHISIIIIQLFPLLVPCVFADRVQTEVRLIKDFLASKLYDKTLDKPSRSTTRTLLALIETRNLSFSLFHMFDIDMSMPFKFMALLLTYLIILLQFDKVISPNKSS